MFIISPIEHFELIAFKKVTRDILQGKNKTSLNDVLNCINYLKKHNIESNREAILQLYKN